MSLLCRRVWLLVCGSAPLRRLSQKICVLRFADLHLIHATRVLPVERTPSAFVMALRPKCFHTGDVRAAGSFSISIPAEFAVAFGIVHVVVLELKHNWRTHRHCSQSVKLC